MLLFVVAKKRQEITIFRSISEIRFLKIRKNQYSDDPFLPGQHIFSMTNVFLLL